MVLLCRKADPDNPEDMEGFRLLVREYADSLGLDLAYQGLEEELAGLPGKYAEPEGTMILAEAFERVGARGDGLCGCVAMKRLEPGVCEMKRLYVRKEWRGRGLGKLLVGAIVAEAREKGYKMMRLDSLERMGVAVQLYRSFGFRQAPAYVFNPIEDAVFMEKDLNPEP